MWNRRDVMAAAGATAVASTAFGKLANAAEAAIDTVTVSVDLAKTVGALDHIWSKSAGSDRAAISLRDQWRQDLVRFQKEAGIQRVRFHGIFSDELGVYAPGLMSPKKVPNWQNVDRVYDGLIERGVQPFVEIGFMPKYLASGKNSFGFYNANVTPPVSQAEWGDFITQFGQHLVQRYGATEVRSWMFEVWNEPNLPFFWSGQQADYFELYKTTVTAMKGVDKDIQVGGPATSSIQWIPEFLAYCQENNLPVDFVSTHIYAADKQERIFGAAGVYGQNDVIAAGMKKVREQIDATAFAGRPLWLSEWSSDSPAMIAHVVKGCMPYCQAMSQWTFSNTYEELGVSPYILKEGDNGFGMMAVAGIPKPQFNTYKLLHRLGDIRLSAEDGPVLASRRADGTSAIAVWNLANVAQASGIPGASWTRNVSGEPKAFSVTLKGAKQGQKVKVSYVDQTRGSPYPAWRELGSPQYPTLEQIDKIRKSAELAAPEVLRVGKSGVVSFTLPPEGLALLEI